MSRGRGAYHEDVGVAGEVEGDGPRDNVAGGGGVQHVLVVSAVCAKLEVLRLVPGALPVRDHLAALHAARVRRLTRIVLRQHLCKAHRARQAADLHPRPRRVELQGYAQSSSPLRCGTDGMTQIHHQLGQHSRGEPRVLHGGSLVVAFGCPVAVRSCMLAVV